MNQPGRATALRHNASPFSPVLTTALGLSIAFSVAETCFAIVASSPSIPFPAAIKAAIACAESGAETLRGAATPAARRKSGESSPRYFLERSFLEGAAR